MRVILMFHCEDKVTRQCPQTTAVFEEKGEPKRNRAAALLLRLTARPDRLSLFVCLFVCLQIKVIFRVMLKASLNQFIHEQDN